MVIIGITALTPKPKFLRFANYFGKIVVKQRFLGCNGTTDYNVELLARSRFFSRKFLEISRAPVYT